MYIPSLFQIAKILTLTTCVCQQVSLAQESVSTRTASRPQVRQVELPTDQVANFFPITTAVRNMPIAELQQLLKRVQEKDLNHEEQLAPRILRVKHHAKENENRLEGRTTLLIQKTSQDSLIDLAPWSPAIRNPDETDAKVLTSDKGRVFLLIEKGPEREIHFRWSQLGVKNCDSTDYRVELPDCAIATLDLELPKSLKASVSSEHSGLNSSGFVTNSSSDRDMRLWTMPSARGLFKISLHPETNSLNKAQVATLSGRTVVNHGIVQKTWEANWVAQIPTPGVFELELDVDPRLHIESVSGSKVQQYRIDTTEAGTSQLSIRLDPGANHKVDLKIKASYDSPQEGNWGIPTLTPKNAIWTGGQYEVEFPPQVRVDEITLSGAIQIPSTKTDQPSHPLTSVSSLRFESTAPGSPGTLLLSSFKPELRAHIAGALAIDLDNLQFEARVTWLTPPQTGEPLTLQIAPGWTIELLQFLEIDEATSWNIQGSGPENTQIIKATVPNSLGPGAPLTALLRGHGTSIQRQSLQPPCIRIPDIEISEETWCLVTDPKLSARPLETQGVAWINPTIAYPDYSNFQKSPLQPPSRIAWRSLSQQQLPTFKVTLRAGSLAATCWTVAEPNPESRQIEWFIRLQGIEGHEYIDIFSNLAQSEPLTGWISSGNTSTLLNIKPEPVSQNESSNSSLISRLRVNIPFEFRGISQLLLKVQLPNNQSLEGAIALPSFDSKIASESFALLYANPENQLQTTIAEVDPVAPDVLATELVQIFSDRFPYAVIPGKYSYPREAYRIRTKTAQIKTLARSLPRAGKSGIIEEVSLFERLCTEDQIEAVLAMELRADGSAPLGIKFSDRPQILEVFIDDQPSVANIVNGQLSIKFKPAENRSSDGTTHIRIRYRKDLITPGSRTWDQSWPQFSLPCFTMRWLGITRSDRIPEWITGKVSDLSKQLERIALSTDKIKESELKIQQRESKLESMFAKAYSPEATLGNVLLKLDATGTTLVLDTLALGSLGLTFSSRPSQPTESNQFVDMKSWLTSMSLSALSTADGTLVTDVQTANILSNNFALLSAQVQTCILNRYDPQTRWIVATAWQALGNGPSMELVDSKIPLDENLKSWVQPGLDSNNPETELTKARPDFGTTFWIGVGLATACMAFLPQKVHRSCLVIFSLMLLVFQLLPRAENNNLLQAGEGLALGSGLSAILSLSWAISCRPLRRLPWVQQLKKWKIKDSLIIFLFISSCFYLCRSTIQAMEEPTDEIIALLPYDQNSDRNLNPTRAILRIQDLERLESFLKSNLGPHTTLPVASIDWARYRFDQLPSGNILLTSNFSLVKSCSNGGDWIFSIGEAISVEAWVDGESTPIILNSTNQEAKLHLRPKSLSVEIRMCFEKPSESGSIRVPLIPVVSSELLLASGSPTCEIEGNLYSNTLTDTVIPIGIQSELRLPTSQDKTPSIRADRPRNALVIWGLEPAGDRLQILLDHTKTTTPSKSASITIEGDWNLLESRGGSTSVIPCTPLVRRVNENQTQLEFVDYEQETLRVTLWRASKALGSHGRAEFIRQPPQITYEGWNISQSTTALQISPILSTSQSLRSPDGIPISQKLFLATWGETGFEDRPFTAIRSGGPDVFGTLSCAPTRSTEKQVSVTTNLNVQTDRIAISYNCSLRSERFQHERLLVKIPSSFHLDKIQGANIQDIYQSRSGEYVLCYDGLPADFSTVAIKGWISLDIDPNSAATEPRRIGIPKLNWVDFDETEGELLIDSIPEVTVELEKTSGLIPVPLGAQAITGGPRLRYRLRPDVGEIRMLWSLLGRPASVSVISHLTVLPEAALWHAQIHYAIDHGPLHQLIVELPTVWADQAHFEVSGSRSIVRKFSIGARTRVEIQLLDSCWGMARLNLTSEIETSDSSLNFPDITPLGLGRADTYIAWSNLTGHPLVAEGSSGVQPVEVERFLERSEWLLIEANPRAYHVLRNGWALRVREPQVEKSVSISTGLLTRVQAELSPDGKAIGSTIIDCFQRRTNDLILHIPEGTDFWGACIDGRWIKCNQFSHNQVRIPTPAAKRSRLRVFWSSTPLEASQSGTPEISPVLPEIEELPFTIQLFSSSPVKTVSTRGHVREISTTERQDFEFQNQIEQIQQTVSSLDRSNQIARADLLVDIVEFLIQIQEAQQALRTRLQVSGQSNASLILSNRISKLQNYSRDLEESLRTYGLESMVQESRERVGVEQESLAGVRVASTKQPRFSDEPLLSTGLGRLSFLGKTTQGRGTGVKLKSTGRSIFTNLGWPSTTIVLNLVLPLAILTAGLFLGTSSWAIRSFVIVLILVSALFQASFYFPVFLLAWTIFTLMKSTQKGCQQVLT